MTSTNLTPDFRLDTKGESCPYPVISMLDAMTQLRPGQILEVISDCSQTINTIPLDAKSHGYQVLEVQQDGPVIRYLIRR